MWDVVVVVASWAASTDDEVASDGVLDVVSVVSGFSVVTVEVATTLESVSVTVSVDVDEVDSWAATRATGDSASARPASRFAQRMPMDAAVSSRG